MNTSPSRYSTLTISLHWLMLLLMIAVYATIELRVMFPKGAPPREAIKALHFMLGLCVLLLVVPRLVARLFGTTPRMPCPNGRRPEQMIEPRVERQIHHYIATTRQVLV